MAATIIHTEAHGAVGLIRLNRPEALNALNGQVMLDVVEAMEVFDRDPAIGAIVLTGDERAFAAGADIKEMADASAVEMLQTDRISLWDRLRKIKIPLVAAVSGWCLGGGNELAMACDMIVAADDAVFGQPEIRIGVMPGAGGTQRLTRAIGKARAMELILTGDTIPAREALALGLVTRVVGREETLAEALRLAARIAEMPPLAVMAAKEAVNRAYELSLEAGLEFERRNFFLLFASEDQKEGMQAFTEKRPARWKGR
jgi:enoyl-CoA hydratase